MARLFGYARAPMALRGGRYEILRMIASGGMATVHLGRTLGMGGFERLVAVKVMHPHVASEPECVDMFLDEARLAARIHHPNVVSTIDVSEDEEGVFLVMEFVEGPSFQGLLRALKKKKQEGPLDVLLRVFMDALAGLHAAHELPDVDGTPLNLVHRDVSPANILIGVDGRARITDFGVARAETRLSATQSGQVKGKFAYMAPEQVRMLPVDRRADIYSAGVMLWEMLTGEKLLKSDNELGMLTQILAHKFAAPHELKPSIPEKLSAVCMQALRFKPEERFPTAAAMAEAIEEAARESGIGVASARAVADFVKELGAHEPVGDLSGGEKPNLRATRGSMGSIYLTNLNKSAAAAQAVAEARAAVQAVAGPDVQVSEEPALAADLRTDEGVNATPPSATVTSSGRISLVGKKQGKWITGALVAAAAVAIVIAIGMSGNSAEEQAAAASPAASAASQPESTAALSAAPALPPAAPSVSAAAPADSAASPSGQSQAEGASSAEKKPKNKGKKPSVYRPWQL